MRAEFHLFGRRINMAPRARRRWLVVLIYAGFGALWSGFWLFASWREAFVFVMFLLVVPTGSFVNRYLLGGYGYGGLIKPFNNTTPWPYETPRDPHWLCLVLQLPPSPDKFDYRNDERELHQRDHAHFQAYRIVSFLLAIVALLIYMGRFGQRYLGFLSNPFDLPLVVALAALFISRTLPQAILLWTEPDMEPEQG